MDITKKIVIMVTGCHAQPDNYKECERTWIPKLRELGFKVLISLGSTEVDKNGVLTLNDFENYFKFLDKNTIEFRTFDSKLGLFDKSIKLPSKWVLNETDYEYYFRIDSDSFVHPERFKKMLEDNLKDFPDLDYMGCGHPNFGYNPHYYFTKIICRTGFFASGCGYLVSKRGMKIVLDKMKIQQKCDFEMDDLVLGRAMWESRVPLLHDSRICFESNYVKLAFDPHNIGIPDISELNSHLAIQHYMNGHMEETMKKLNL
jgi:hypothetical protein